MEDMVPLEGILPDQGWPGRVEGSSVAVEISKKKHVDNLQMDAHYCVIYN